MNSITVKNLKFQPNFEIEFKRKQFPNNSTYRNQGLLKLLSNKVKTNQSN